MVVYKVNSQWVQQDWHSFTALPYPLEMSIAIAELAYHRELVTHKTVKIIVSVNWWMEQMYIYTPVYTFYF